MKYHVRTLNPQYTDLVPCAYGFVSVKRMLWHDAYEKEVWRKYLNSLGFYVITGTGDSLDVYVLEDDSLFKYIKRGWKELYECVVG